MPELTIDQIRERIRTDNRALERALVVLHERQTIHERAVRASIKSNGVGFNAADARRLSELAEWVERKENAPLGRRLFPRQHEAARALVAKYAGQLLDAHRAKLAN